MKIAAAPLGPFETNAYLIVAENGKDSRSCFVPTVFSEYRCG